MSTHTRSNSVPKRPRRPWSSVGRGLLRLAALVALSGCHTPVLCTGDLEPSAGRLDRPPGLPSRGPVDAPVVIEEFSGYACPRSAAAQNTLAEVFARYPGVLRHIHRHLPLPAHAHSEESARAAVAAHRQGRFWEYHALLFEQRGTLDRPTLIHYARRLRLDIRRFEDDLGRADTRAAVQRDAARARELDALTSPQFFVNGRRVPDPPSLTVFQEIIEETLSAR